MTTARGRSSLGVFTSGPSRSAHVATSVKLSGQWNALNSSYKDGAGVEAAHGKFRVIQSRWVISNNGSNERPKLRARWVAQKLRGHSGDRQTHLSGTRHLALIKAVIAHTAQLSGQCGAVAKELHMLALDESSR